MKLPKNKNIYHFKLFIFILLHAAMSLELFADESATFTYPLTSTEAAYHWSFIGHLNNDCVTDTLVSQFYTERFLPRFILWGVSDSTSCADSLSYPDSLRVPITRIDYPDWDFLRGTFAVEYVDTDTLKDIIFYIKGRTVGENPRDTVRLFTVFGQDGLDTNNIIDVSQTDSIQSYPFFACNLQDGRGLTAPGVRDISGRISYRGQRIDLGILMPEPIAVLSKEADEIVRDYKITLFPNPAVYSANIELENLPPGKYTLSIISMQGKTILKELIDIYNASYLLQPIDLSNLASGYYTVRLSNEGRIVKIMSMMIVK